MDQTRTKDQSRGDQKLAALAEALLEAVAKGSRASVDVAALLAAAVLDEPRVAKARELEELLRTASPFALVRAVRLAEEIVIDAPTLRGSQPRKERETE